MSEMEKREEVSRYESMSTEDLQEILRKHAHDELDTEPSTEELYEIMEVLAVRRQKEEPNAYRSDEEAFAEFCKHYMPKENEEKRPVVRWYSGRFFKPVFAVLALVLVLAMGTTVTAKALHVDLWGKFANWTKEIFQFETHDGAGSTAPELTDSMEYKELRNALAEYQIEEKLVPAWLPEGYVHKDVRAVVTPKVRNITARFEKDGMELIIKIRQTVDVPANQVEKNDDLMEVYEVNGVEYFIFSNTEMLQVKWSVGEMECTIGGKLSLEEVKQMISSIR